MKKIYPALSIVAPSGTYIAEGLKTLEIRSWRPEQLPVKDLVIVENAHYLNRHGDEEQGRGWHGWILPRCMLGNRQS